MQRYIKVPETVQLVNLITDQNVKEYAFDENGAHILEGEGEQQTKKVVDKKKTFKSFLVEIILVDPKFGKTSADVLKAVEIRQAFRSASPGDIVEIEDSDWATMAEVVKEPASGYTPVVALQLAEFITCILDAPTRDPRKVAKSKK